MTTFASLPQAFFNAGSQIAQGHLADAVQTLWGGILPLVIIPIIPITAVAPVVQTAVQNVANVIGALGGVNLLITGIAVISPLYATITQFGNTAQAIFDAAGKGDFATVASEILNAPAALTNAFLNGDDSTPGLLTPTSGVGGGGTIAALLNLRDTVAGALKPAAVPTPAAARSAAASKRATTVHDRTRSAGQPRQPKASGDRQQRPAGTPRPTARPAAQKVESPRARPVPPGTAARRSHTRHGGPPQPRGPPLCESAVTASGGRVEVDPLRRACRPDALHRYAGNLGLYGASAQADLGVGTRDGAGQRHLRPHRSAARSAPRRRAPSRSACRCRQSGRRRRRCWVCRARPGRRCEPRQEGSSPSHTQPMTRARRAAAP